MPPFPRLSGCTGGVCARDQAREELERVHEERLSKLRTREESLMERARRQAQALEAAAYEHRQRLLKDGEVEPTT